MNSNWLNSIVRILGPKGQTAGTGSVVSEDGLIATCAHVIRAASSQPGEQVDLIFHYASNPIQATVVPEWFDQSKDVAILQLISPIENLQALPLSSSANQDGHPVRTFGYPNLDVNGIHGKGTFDGRIQHQDGITLLQLELASDYTWL